MLCAAFPPGVRVPGNSLRSSRTGGSANKSAGYETKYFWIDYPHKELTFELKAYYLMQAGYWLQQTIILAGKIEKPRKDFKELVVHVRQNT